MDEGVSMGSGSYDMYEGTKPVSLTALLFFGMFVGAFLIVIVRIPIYLTPVWGALALILLFLVIYTKFRAASAYNQLSSITLGIFMGMLVISLVWEFSPVGI